MSAGDDSFFARWSRRKQAVRSAEAPTAHEERHTAEVAPAEEDAGGCDLQLSPEGPVAAEAPEPLPRLEDLTAKSDLAAFLRKGVPRALKNAAMRKMWSLDPTIRDYTGPAEYAWDFNKPGSMAGFGPLEAKESVAEFLSTMSGVLPADSENPAAAASEVPAAPGSAGQITATDQAAAALPEEPSGASLPVEPVEPRHLPAIPQSPHSAAQATVAASAPVERTGPAESSETSAPRRHGGAVPR